MAVAQEAFAAFVGERLAGVVEADHAWTMAETWDVARENRQLRDFVRSDPDEAVRLVSDLAEAATDEGQPMLALDEDDRRVTEVMAAPKRQRRSILRELVRSAREGQARSPEDVRRIEELERERDEAALQPGNGPASELARELSAAEADLARLADACEGLHLSDGQRQRLLRIGDLAMGAMVRILETLTLGPPE